MKYLLAAYAWATIEWGTPPLKFKQPLPPSPPRDRWLTNGEAHKLLEATRAYHIRLFILLALQTAQRSIAICDLTWEKGVRGQRINLEDNLIDFGQGTGNKRRAIVPINPQLREALEEARECATCDYVVEYAIKKVINPRKSVSRSAERAGLGKLGKHILRHTAATWMVMDSRSDEETARCLGTTVDVVRKVYGHHDSDFLKSAAKALEI